MPPKKGKKGGGGKGGRADKKQKEKLIEDKTFGLKNKKKSKKVQQYVQNVAQQVKYAGRDHKQIKREQMEKDRKKAEREAKAKAASEIGALFQAVQSGKGPDKNIDPKSQLCAFFKAGHCKRGRSCKFSHDLNIERKAAKINVYNDPRQEEKMEDWDQEKLEEVVAKKAHKRSNQTDIICKYFLDAIEQKKYGWFWQCPNGNNDCIYRHALPPGYVLKSEKKAEEENKEDGPSLEEQIEEERAKLDHTNCTMVTAESFAKWKADRKEKRDNEAKERAAAVLSKKNQKHGKSTLSGRDLFTFDPTLFVDDADAADDDMYEIEEKKEESDDKNDQVTTVNDASLFLDDDVDLPDDDDEDDA